MKKKTQIWFKNKLLLENSKIRYIKIKIKFKDFSFHDQISVYTAGYDEWMRSKRVAIPIVFQLNIS